MEDDERGPYRSDARASDPIRKEGARNANSDTRRVSDDEGDPRSLKPCPLRCLSEALQECDKVK
jgi:hypothetical protein